MGDAAEIVSAGAVVSRTGRSGPEVLLVHRPKYDDWSFPKGKLDPGEHLVTAAVREVAEETGLDIRLGPPLTKQRYRVGNGEPRSKVVHYWAGRVVGDDGDDVASYRPNAEVDQVLWVAVADAEQRLTYRRDRETLAEAARFRETSYPLVVLRAGDVRAEQVVPLLRAYGVRRPDVGENPDLTEADVTRETVSGHVKQLLDTKEPAALCTRRTALAWVFEALAVEDRSLERGAIFVAHQRGGTVVATEEHSP